MYWFVFSYLVGTQIRAQRAVASTNGELAFQFGANQNVRFRIRVFASENRIGFLTISDNSLCGQRLIHHRWVVWGPEWGTPPMAKVMRKEARHTQRWDRASGVPLDMLEHLPPKNQSLPTLLLCALTPDFTGGCPPPPSRSLCQRVNLQLQLIKFLGN